MTIFSYFVLQGLVKLRYAKLLASLYTISHDSTCWWHFLLYMNSRFSQHTVVYQCTGNHSISEQAMSKYKTHKKDTDYKLFIVYLSLIPLHFHNIQNWNNTTECNMFLKKQSHNYQTMILKQSSINRTDHYCFISANIQRLMKRYKTLKLI